jgi:hypothetical protein
MEFTIKSFFKKFYKKIVIKIFQIIYGKPKLLKKKNKDKTIEEFQISFDKISYKIFKLSNGAVYTDSNDTTAYISENKYLSSASMQYYKVDNINSFNGSLSENETLSFGTPKIKKKIKGNVLSLLSGGASKDNFTHWFTDVIPRIRIYSKRFKLSNIDKFYVPNLKYNFQKESLKLLGIDEKQIINSNKYKHIKADCIYTTSHPCFHLPMKVKKWSLDYLNKSFSKSSYKNKFKKIFLDRDQLKLINLDNLKKYKDYRILLNEDQIREFLSSEGFDVVKPEEYPFDEQVKIFSSAKYVVGLYGAAMMMLSFCKKNTKVLEIKPLLGGNEFKNISKLMKLKHRQINLKPLFTSSTPQNGLLNCPLEKIKKELYLLSK